MDKNKRNSNLRLWHIDYKCFLKYGNLHSLRVSIQDLKLFLTCPTRSAKTFIHSIWNDYTNTFILTWIIRTWCLDICDSIFITSRSCSYKVHISFRNIKRSFIIGNAYCKLNIKLNTIKRNCNKLKRKGLF